MKYIFQILSFQLFFLLLLAGSAACVERQLTYGCPEEEVRRGFIQVARELGGEVRKVDKKRVRVTLPDADFLLTFVSLGKTATEVGVESAPGRGAKALAVRRMVLNLVSYRLSRRKALEFADSSAVFRHYARAAVCIFGKMIGYGQGLQVSGVMVSSSGLVLTTAHDLDSTTSVVVQLYDGTVRRGRVVASDLDFDLAVIATGIKSPDFIDVGSPDLSGIPSTGTRIWTLGCPLGLSETSARGIITAPPRLMGSVLLYQSDLPAYHGSSGSPVFDSSGRLLALVKGRIRGLPKISLLVPVFYARSLLFRVKEDVGAGGDDHKQGKAGDAYAWLVRALAASKYAEKKQALLKAIELNPDFEPALYHLGILYSSRPDNARLEQAVWERLSGLEPEWGEVYFRLGNCLLRQGRLASAKKQYGQAHKYLKGDPRVLNNLGEVLRRMGMFRDARTAFRKALSVNPDYAPAHFNLGILYEQNLKDPERAIFHYRQYLNLSPGAKDSETVEKWISKLEAGL